MDVRTLSSQPESAQQQALAERIAASFARQRAMELIRAELASVSEGSVDIRLPHWRGVEQQHGFVHGGIVSMIADSAAGYAAMTVTPDDASVLSVEFKLNLMAPAQGDALIARGKVVRPGRTLIITQAEVYALVGERETLCALMQQTIMVMRGKAERN